MSADFSNSEEKRINCAGGFGIIPFYLSRDKNIPDGAKLLFSDMWLAQLQKGYCSLSNSELAEIRNVSTRTITSWVNLLKENGWIKTQYVLTKQGEIKQRNIYLNPKPEINNINEKISEADFYTPRNQFPYPLETSFHTYNIREEISNKILKNTKKEQPIENNIPASGSPSSPDGDEFKEQVDPFDSFWSKVQYKSQKVTARNEWNKITNNGKNQQKIKEVGEGYERYVSFLAKERARGFDRPHMDMSTFLNPTKMRWADEWKTEREQRQEQQPTQTENQKYWEEHENTQVVASKKIEQPKNIPLRVGIAKKLGLLDKFLPDEYDREWKYIPGEVKEILTSEVIEKTIKEIKAKDDALITQIACVTMIGREGYCTWQDKYEEEKGERPLYDVEFYIPFGKKLPGDIWKWIVKYSHNFGLPSEAHIDRVRKWFYSTPRNPIHFLFA